MRLVFRPFVFVLLMMLLVLPVGCGGSNAKSIKNLASDAAGLLRPGEAPRVKRPIIDGDTGRVEVEYSDNTKEAFDVVKEGGKWVIENCLDEDFDLKPCFRNQGTDLPSGQPPQETNLSLREGEEVADCEESITSPELFRGLCTSLASASALDSLLYRFCRDRGSSVVACLP